MKKLFTLIVALGFYSGIQAQTFGGPDAFGYVWRNNSDPNGPTYNWINIDALPGTTTVSGLQDDNIVGPFVMPINFTYYWYQPNVFYIGSNGYLGFSSTPVASPFPAIPTPSGIQNYLAGMCSDLTFVNSQGGTIPTASCKYWVSPGSDSLIVTWNNVPFWVTGTPGFGGFNTFQIILSAADSSITYQYQAQNGGSTTSNFCSIGIENISGNIGLQYLYNAYPIPQTSVKFYYPASTTLAITDAATSYVGADGSKGFFLSKDGDPYLSVAEVKNTGNQTLNPFNVYSRVVNNANQIQVRDTVATSTLSPGQIEVINFPDAFSPTAAGTFRHIVVTQLTGDATPSNNQRERELVVVDTTLLNIKLSYNNDIASTNGISWSGGGGGIGYYFAPPFTPCYLNQVSLHVASDPQAVGFYIQVYKDDGPNGAPGTLLDSIFVTPANVVAGITTVYNLSQPVLIGSGGFYVAWMMGGTGIVLGEDGVNPYSGQCYEILGSASNPNAWAEYRNGEISDPIINAIIATSPLGLPLNDIKETTFGACQPNPAINYTRIPYSIKQTLKNAVVTVFDIQGKLVHKKVFESIGAGQGMLYLNTEHLQAGSYIVQINQADISYRSKLNIIK